MIVLHVDHRHQTDFCLVFVVFCEYRSNAVTRSKANELFVRRRKTSGIVRYSLTRPAQMIGLHVNHCHYTDGLVSLVFCEYRSNATFFECELVVVEGGVSFG